MNLNLTKTEGILLSITALLCVTAMEITALLMGLDGAYLLPVITIVSGIAGFAVGLPVKVNDE